MVFSDQRNSVNTVVAPTRTAPMPSTLGIRPVASIRDISTACSIILAASAPMVSASRATISPWAALSPSTMPITATATIRVGARENKVKKAREPA